MGSYRFAESEKSVLYKNAPWFRVNFAAAKFPLGEAQELSLYSRTDKADKSCKDFCFFATFFSKKKVDSVSKAARLSQNRKNLFLKRLFLYRLSKKVILEKLNS